LRKNGITSGAGTGIEKCSAEVREIVHSAKKASYCGHLQKHPARHVMYITQKTELKKNPDRGDGTILTTKSFTDHLKGKKGRGG